MPVTPPKYIDVKGLSSYLSVSDRTIRGWILRRQVPFAKANGRILFDLSEIDAWIKERRIPTAEEVLDQVRSSSGPRRGSKASGARRSG